MAYTGLRVFFIRAPYGVANSPFFVEPWIVRSPICFVPRTVEILSVNCFLGEGRSQLWEYSFLFFLLISTAEGVAPKV